MGEASGQQAYYAVIPANVRYDSGLRPNAKLLYGELTALAGPDGYCWATDKYFAELYGLTATTVNALIKSLEKRGYIRIEAGSNSRGAERHIYAGIYKATAAEPQDGAAPCKTCGETGEGSSEKCEDPPEGSSEKCEYPPGGSSEKCEYPPGGSSEKCEEGSSDFCEAHKVNNINSLYTPPVFPPKGEQKGRKSAGNAYPPDHPAMQCAVWLDRKISLRLPSRPAAKERDLQRWAADIDKIARIDGYAWRTISHVLRFSQSDEFWQKNILSGRTFRAKFVQLYAKSGEPPA